jgi:hypothetical protein
VSASDVRAATITGFSRAFCSAVSKCQGLTRKDGARTALPKLILIFLLVWMFLSFLLLCMFRSLYPVYCLCVNV